MESDNEFPSQMSQMISLGRVPKARSSLLPSQQRGRQPRSWNPASAPPPARKDASPALDPGVQRFRDLVQNAEKSTLLFNLDMGRVPIINKESMGVKATKALTAMAAAAEERPASNPSRDTVDAIDDALSVADKISFFGSSTKSCKGTGENSGSYCTIPVCYTFPDKETRAKAEQVLRSRCKVSCTTPYPQALRACIKQVLDSGRRARPEDYCAVKVDLPKLSFGISWRAKNTANWSKYDNLIPIPGEVVHFPSKVQEGGYQLLNLPVPAERIPTGPSTGPLRLPPNFFETVVIGGASGTPHPPPDEAPGAPPVPSPNQLYSPSDN